ncbi:alpha/beta hydrolase [Halobacillus locisalis]|uniref:Alpha/beta hydrolase n=1 Tax=Halobacillus locisalis TaxID=220753 RepID=A0A838CYU2_9BACI|nr:alpha/beta hydrolase [Halobacillus locisalis]MBA2176646.1 alpha/beta hydrolase [Halobacillus locisalis]
MTLGYKTYVRDASKSWIVFFHGFGGNYTIFNRQINDFKENYNLLFIDLPGHGESPNINTIDENVLDFTGQKVIELLDRLNIQKPHFIGVSLGTIVIQHIAMVYPSRIKSMILSGAVGKWLWWGELVGKVALSFPIRQMLPYMVPYVSFAYILMPKKNHKKSRNMFIREALKLGQDSYLRWLYILRDANSIYKSLRAQTNHIPKLYISGDEDHMFLRGITRHVKEEHGAKLEILKKCGHVCNIEQSALFNKLSLQFIQQLDPA